MRIAYLGPDESLHPDDFIRKDKLNNAILKHPKTLFYTPDGFVEAFNAEEISDLGWIAIDKDSE